MATSQYRNTSPSQLHPRSPKRHTSQLDPKKVEEKDIVQGRLFWLPPKEEVNPRALRRAHGKGAIEEGIYNHPVVVISRPADERDIVHFQIITSFQGKKLHEIYSRSNDFHASRRSWYLPISPSPEHPDATSKKTRKRFPTLELADSAMLRWDSYANLRSVYKIDWKYLRPYINPDTPGQEEFHFDRDSMIRLLAKTKVLTNYEPGPQYAFSESPIPRLGLPTMASINGRHQPRRGSEHRSPRSSMESPSPISSEFSDLSPRTPSDFGNTIEDEERNMSPPPKAPPDRRMFFRNMLRWLLLYPLALIRLCLRIFRKRFGKRK